MTAKISKASQLAAAAALHAATTKAARNWRRFAALRQHYHQLAAASVAAKLALPLDQAAVEARKKAVETEVGELLKGLKVRPTRECDFQGFIAPRLANAGFGKRYCVDGLLDGPDPRIALQREKLGKIREDLRGVGAIDVLAGPRGTGKTTITSEVVKERLWAYHAVAILLPAERPLQFAAGLPAPRFFYLKVTDLNSQLKPLYADFGSLEIPRLTALRAAIVDADLVILDEWQECPEESRFKNPITTDILDRRYSAKRDSLIITNQTADNFEETINPSLLSRIHEHGRILVCDWTDFRTQPPLSAASVSVSSVPSVVK